MKIYTAEESSMIFLLREELSKYSNVKHNTDPAKGMGYNPSLTHNVRDRIFKLEAVYADHIDEFGPTPEPWKTLVADYTKFMSMLEIMYDNSLKKERVTLVPGFDPTETINLEYIDVDTPEDARAYKETYDEGGQTRIGDVILDIPPEQIGIRDMNTMTSIPVLRSGALHMRTGQGDIQVEFTIEVPSIAMFNAKVRPLLAQIFRTPWLPLDNYHIKRLFMPYSPTSDVSPAAIFGEVQKTEDPVKDVVGDGAVKVEIPSEKERAPVPPASMAGAKTSRPPKKQIDPDDLDLFVVIHGVSIQTVPGYVGMFYLVVSASLFNHYPYVDKMRYLIDDSDVESTIQALLKMRDLYKTTSPDTMKEMLGDVGNFKARTTRDISKSIVYKKYYQGLLDEFRGTTEPLYLDNYPTKPYEGLPYPTLDDKIMHLLEGTKSQDIMLRGKISEAGVVSLLVDQIERLEGMSKELEGIDSIPSLPSSQIGAVGSRLKAIVDTLKDTIDMITHYVPNYLEMKMNTDRFTSFNIDGQLYVGQDGTGVPIPIEQYLEEASQTAGVDTIRAMIKQMGTTKHALAANFKMDNFDVVIPNDSTTTITGVTASYSTSLVPMMLAGHEYPTFQALGSGEFSASINVTTTNYELVRRIKFLSYFLNRTKRRMDYTSADVAFTNAQITGVDQRSLVRQFYKDMSIEVLTEDGERKNFLNSLGINKVLITEANYTTVKGQPGTWSISLTLAHNTVDIARQETFYSSNFLTDDLVQEVVAMMLYGDVPEDNVWYWVAQELRRIQAEVEKMAGNMGKEALGAALRAAFLTGTTVITSGVVNYAVPHPGVPAPPRVPPTPFATPPLLTGPTVGMPQLTSSINWTTPIPSYGPIQSTALTRIPGPPQFRPPNAQGLREALGAVRGGRLNMSPAFTSMIKRTGLTAIISALIAGTIGFVADYTLLFIQEWANIYYINAQVRAWLIRPELVAQLPNADLVRRISEIYRSFAQDQEICYPDLGLPPFLKDDVTGVLRGSVRHPAIYTPPDFYIAKGGIVNEFMLQSARAILENSGKVVAELSRANRVVDGQATAPLKLSMKGIKASLVESVKDLQNQWKVELTALEAIEAGKFDPTTPSGSVNTAVLDGIKARKMELQRQLETAADEGDLTRAINQATDAQLQQYIYGFNTEDSTDMANEVMNDVIVDLGGMRYNDKTLQMSRAYPTFKLYFVEEDSNRFLSFSDVYSYNSIISIDIVWAKGAASKTAVIKLSNLTSALSDPLGIKAEETFYPLLHGKYQDTQQEQTVDGIFIRPGLRVIIKLGYSNDPTELETVFDGPVTTVTPGDQTEIVCQSWAVELTNVIGLDKDGVRISRANQLVEVGKLIHGEEFDIGFGDVARVAMRKCGDLSHFGQSSPFMQSVDFQPHKFSDKAKSDVIKFVINQLAGNDALDNIISRIQRLFVSSQDDNIWLAWNNSVPWYKGSVREESSYGFNWVIKDQTGFEAIQELLLWFPDYIMLELPYNEANLKTQRSTLYIGPRDGLYLAEDIDPVTNPEMYERWIAWAKSKYGQGDSASAPKAFTDQELAIMPPSEAEGTDTGGGLTKEDLTKVGHYVTKKSVARDYYPWRWPVDGGSIKADSSFGVGRPGHIHSGVDIVRPKGTPCYATVDGTVHTMYQGVQTYTDRNGVKKKRAGGGNIAYIRTPDSKWSVYYMHLDRFAEGKSAGNSWSVKVGDLIGYIGNSGYVHPDDGGEHLHYETRPMVAGKEQKPGLDPMSVIRKGRDLFMKEPEVAEVQPLPETVREKPKPPVQKPHAPIVEAPKPKQPPVMSGRRDQYIGGDSYPPAPDVVTTPQMPFGRRDQDTGGDLYPSLPDRAVTPPMEPTQPAPSILLRKPQYPSGDAFPPLPVTTPTRKSMYTADATEAAIKRAAVQTRKDAKLMRNPQDFYGAPGFKRVTRTHFFDSIHHIVSNNITASINNMWNAVRLEYPAGEPVAEKGKGPGSARDNRHKTDVFELYLDREMNTSNIRMLNVFEKNIDPDTLDGILRWHGETERWVNNMGDLSSIPMYYRIATTILANGMKEMYGGTLTVLMDPSIRPYDRCYLFDYANDMYGPFEVAEVHHSFNIQTGATTTIVPALIVEQQNYPAVIKESWLQTMVTGGLAAWIGLTLSGAAIGARFGNVPGAVLGGLGGTIYGGVQFDKLWHGMGSYLLGREASISFSGLWYKGRPFCAGVEGMRRESFNTVLADKVYSLSEGLRR